MRFLADESCDFTIVRALREAGYDVAAVAEVTPGAEDEAVIELAGRESRILLTEDKDFGRQLYVAQKSSPGVMLLRFPARARGEIARTVVEIVGRRGDRLKGRFTVVAPGRVRISETPRG